MSTLLKRTTREFWMVIRSLQPVSVHAELWLVSTNKHTRNTSVNQNKFLGSGLSNMGGWGGPHHWTKFPVTGKNFLSQEDVSYHRKKIPVTGRKFLSQEENPVTGKIFISKDKISSQKKKFPITERNFLLQEEVSCCRKKIFCHTQMCLCNTWN